MSNEGFIASICAQMNNALQIHDLVDYIDWYPDKLIRSGDVYLALCPIHRDPTFRTLVLNPRNNTYICKHINCLGNQPADLIDLIVKAKDEPVPEALANLVERFGADYFHLTERQQKVIADLNV